LFDVQPISTTNLFTAAQILVVGLGFIFSWIAIRTGWNALNITTQNLEIATKSLNTSVNNLEMATASARAQLYNQMVIQARDLQFRFMELFFEDDLPAKQDIFLGTLIGYYAACFEMRRLFKMPESVEKLLDADLKKLLDEPRFVRKWESIRNMYSREFNAYVTALPGV
jgi:hypothetical protein